ncbi:hypothetical protein JCM10295v2_006535 [Rhodotorula toruloides]
MPGSATATDSDFGPELDYDDALEAHLLVFEQNGISELVVRSGSDGIVIGVQHSYRLASKPYLPPSERPATITTASGAEIAVDKVRTVERDNTLVKGREVHKKIEKEVMGDVKEVQVDVTGKEEWWALRILNTVVGLEALLTAGRVRELPVVGWVNDFLVFGVIDEVERRELPPLPSPSPQSTGASQGKPKRTPKKGKKSGKAPATSTKRDEQSKLTAFFSPSPSPAKRGGMIDLTDGSPAEESELEQPTPVGGQPRWGFILSDTKTRYKRSIPPPTETRSTRLQLGLYHRLLSSLLQPETAPSAQQAAEPAFSWTRVYSDLSLDPTEPLSNGFLDSIAPVIQGSSFEESLGEAETLGDFIAVLMKYADMVRGGREHVLEDEVEVVYRMRGSSRPSAMHSPPPPASVTTQPRVLANEDANLQRALAASLAETVDSQPRQSKGGRSTSIFDILTNEEIDAELRDEMSIVTQEPPAENSQLEDSQQPFLANPSLPLPVDHLPPSLSDGPSSSVPSGPNPFALPTNSQGHENADIVQAAGSIRSSRYNLRDRPDATAFRAVQRQGTILDDRPTTPPAVSSSVAASIAARVRDPSDPGLIGVEKIKVDTEELSAWLESISAYWRGEREPIGVLVTEVNRCRFCEFEDGCEWRAAKAAEAMDQAKTRRAARNA